MPQPRLIAIDVDGTLSAGNNDVAYAVRAALRRATSAGLRVLLATGRRYRTTRLILDRLGLPLEAVCLGGALLKAHHGATLASSPIDGGRAATAIALARAHGLSMIVQRDGALTERRDFIIDADVVANAGTQHYLDIGRACGRRGDALAVAAAGEGLVLGLLGEQPALLAFAGALATAQRGAFATVCMPSGNHPSHYLEIAQAHVNKWYGITAVAAREGIADAEICAIGDQLNDLPMLIAAGLAIAMGNAPDSVRAVAHWVAPPVSEHGVAVAIDRLLAGRFG